MSLTNSTHAFVDKSRIRLCHNIIADDNITASQQIHLTLEETLTVIEELEACVRELTTGEEKSIVDIITRVIERKHEIEFTTEIKNFWN